MAREYTAPEAKAEILRLTRLGYTVRECMDRVGKSEKSYEYYKRSDPEFAREVNSIRSKQRGDAKKEVPDFEDFCRDYFGMKLFQHQMQWVDLIHGREPRGLHVSQMYEKKSDRMFIVNTPPEHAKSMTLSINYVTWRIVQNPNVRIIVVSKTATMAKKFLSAVKDRLSKENRQFAKLKEDFAPLDGYDSANAVWRADMIYVNADLRTRGEKDPTVEALGLGQQIYGARADLIILDDTITLDNAHEFEKQIGWLQKEVLSRLGRTGKCLVIGTRLAAQDMYAELLKPEWYSRGVSPWTYLSQPAVLNFADGAPEDWTTLWPRTNVMPDDMGDGVPEPGPDGLYPMWDGPALAEIRDRMSAENWARVYMQAQISDSMTFTSAMMDGCTNQLRHPGPMDGAKRGHRPGGMGGLYVIAGLDPAPTNFTAAVVIGVDRTTGRRYLLDVWTKLTAQPRQVRELVQEWTIRYGVMEWRIEENGLNKYISQDETLVRWCRGRGVGVFGHQTGTNKWDPQFGVATLANLFRGYETDTNMIELPARRDHQGIQTLVTELISWYPTPSKAKMPKQDTVMALWFADLRARNIADEWDQTTHLESRYRTSRDEERQVTFDVDAILARASGDANVINLDEWFAKRR